jgi:hypothetical protein
MAQLYKPDGTVTEVKPQNGKCFTLPELQALVGGHIEAVDVPPWDGSRLAICDEEGKLKDNPKINERATLAAERHNFNDVAVGDWLFAERAELESEDDFDDEDEEEELLV